MSCCGGPHFSYCGWRVGVACDHWWLFSLLWLLCLGHMCIDLSCYLSGLWLSCGVSKLNWWNIVFPTSGGVGVFCWVWRFIRFALVRGELVIRLGFKGSIVLCHWETLSFDCCPLELGNWCLPSIWFGLRGSLCFILYIIYFAFLLYFLHTHLSLHLLY
jgi:hypothetical protein